jgi:type I restriction enzyme, R subunit
VTATLIRLAGCVRYSTTISDPSGEYLREPTAAQREQAKTSLLKAATKIFTGKLCDLLEGIRRDHEQTIDTLNIDQVIFAGWDGQAKENAERLAQDFAQYIQAHKDEIIALSIFYGQPYQRRELTYDRIREVFDKLKSDQPKLAPLRVWQAYAQLDEFKGTAPNNELTALVSLIRRVCGIDASILPYDDTVRRNFQNWVLKRHQGNVTKFNEEQMT